MGATTLGAFVETAISDWFVHHDMSIGKPRMHDARELKLDLAPHQVEWFRRSRLLRSLARGRPTFRRLKSVYFDAPDQALRKRGISLRLDTEGRQRLQKLEVSDVAAGSRREIEVEVTGDTPDISRIENRQLGEIIEDASSEGGLAPLFETDVKRRVLPVALHGTDIDVNLDTGELTGAGRRAPICEAQLELRKGDPARLYELALALHASLPLQIEDRSTATRGYDLISGARPEPVRTMPIVIDRQMTVGDAFVTVARACLGHLRANQRVVSETDDPEGVHQMRVALRRLRTLVGAFRKAMDPRAEAFFKEKCRWLHSAIGPARDWDVFILETLAPLMATRGDDPALAALRLHAVNFRERAYRTARRTLNLPAHTELFLQADAWFETGDWGISRDRGAVLAEPVVPWAERVLRKFARRLHRSVGDASDMAPSELHAARISVKKLRYASDFFRCLFPLDAVSGYTSRLREIQDVLGSLNDIDTGCKLVGALERRMAREGNSAAAARAAGLILGRQSTVAERELARFRSVWKDYLKIEPFWDRD